MRVTRRRTSLRTKHPRGGGPAQPGAEPASRPAAALTSEAELEELRQRNIVVHRNTPQEWDWRK